MASHYIGHKTKTPSQGLMVPAWQSNKIFYCPVRLRWIRDLSQERTFLTISRIQITSRKQNAKWSGIPSVSPRFQPVALKMSQGNPGFSDTHGPIAGIPVTSHLYFVLRYRAHVTFSWGPRDSAGSRFANPAKHLRPGVFIDNDSLISQNHIFF